MCRQLRSVQIGVRQQREVTGALDCGINLTLIVGLGAGQAGRHDLAVFLNEILQGINILVVNLFNVCGGEAAEFFAFEQRILLLAFLLEFELVLVEFFTECHDGLLYLKLYLNNGCLEIDDVKYEAFTVAILARQETGELKSPA